MTIWTTTDEVRLKQSSQTIVSNDRGWMREPCHLDRILGISFQSPWSHGVVSSLPLPRPTLQPPSHNLHLRQKIKSKQLLSSKKGTSILLPEFPPSVICCVASSHLCPHSRLSVAQCISCPCVLMQEMTATQIPVLLVWFMYLLCLLRVSEHVATYTQECLHGHS